MERLGTQGTAPFVIQDDTIPAPSGHGNHHSGGMFHKDTLADILAIPEYYRRGYNGEALWGMTAWAHSDTTTANNGEWELIKGLSSNDVMDNANWRKKQQGAISADDVTESATRVFVTPAERELIRNDKGFYLTESALTTAHPVGEDGWYAVVSATNTFWVWDGSDWVDTLDAATLYVHPNHTGEVTSVGDGAQTITLKAVTNPKLADMAANTIKGAVVSGEPQDLTPTQARAILNVSDGANNYTHPNHSGDVTSVGDGATTISAGAVTFVKIAPAAIAGDGESSATKLLLSNDSRVTGALQSIADDSITDAKLSNMPANSIKGAVVDGDPVNLTKAQVLTLINVQDGATDDQTAAEIRDALVTLTGADRLPASAIKDIPTIETVVVDNLNSMSATSALSANQGYILNRFIQYPGSGRFTQGEYMDDDGEYHLVTLAYNGSLNDHYFIEGFIQGALTYKVAFNDNGFTKPYFGVITKNTGSVYDGTYDILRLPVGFDSDNTFISVKAYWGQALLYRYTRYNGFTSWEYLGGGDDFPQETSTNPEITSSRSVQELHAGSNYINPVDSASQVNLTVQPQSSVPLPVGFTANYAQDGVGKINIVAGTGVTIKSIRNGSNEIKSAAQYGVITLVYEGSDVWRCFGALEQ